MLIHIPQAAGTAAVAIRDSRWLIHIAQAGAATVANVVYRSLIGGRSLTCVKLSLSVSNSLLRRIH